MKNKLFSGAGSVTIILIALFIGFTVIEAGCADKKEKISGPVTRNWIAMDIKFKPSTTAEERDASIRAIEKLLTDSLKGRKYQKLSPSFVIKKGVFDESNTCSLSIQYDIWARDTAVKDPKCLCARDCGVCLTVANFVHNPPDTSRSLAPYRNIAAISILKDSLDEVLPKK